ncbi:MAG: site-specific integrase [archaeon]|nr:site-specific integrase [archaeon]
MAEEIIKLQNPEKYYTALEKLRTDKIYLLIPDNKDLILHFLNDAEIGRTILKGQKRKIKPGRLQRMLGLLLKMDREWLKKAFNEVSEDDMNNFILNLERGIIKSSKGESYTWETQSTIKKFIRKYYKYLLGDGENYPKLVQFIDTSTRMLEVKGLSKQENDKLIENSSKLIYRFILAVLYDSGARIEEFYNIRKSDLSKENGIYKVRIRISKTKPRTINLPLYPKIVDQYLESNNFKEDDFLCTINYGTLRKHLNRIGKQFLKKSISPHTFRHGSATYYANYLNRYQISYRYGWSASSKMPDRYIDMNGLIDDESVTKIAGENFIKTDNENKELKTKLDILSSTMTDLLKKQQEMEKQLEVRRLEGEILTETNNSKVGNSDVELITFLNERKDVVGSLKQILSLIEI